MTQSLRSQLRGNNIYIDQACKCGILWRASRRNQNLDPQHDGEANEAIAMYLIGSCNVCHVGVIVSLLGLSMPARSHIYLCDARITPAGCVSIPYILCRLYSLFLHGFSVVLRKKRGYSYTRKEARPA